MTAYDLDDRAFRALSAAALAGHPSGARFVALALRPDDPRADLARTLERRVFEEAFGNDAATMAAEYGSYEKESVFFLVLDRHTGRPAGAGRAIEGGGKTFDDAPGCIGVPLGDIIAAHGMHEGTIWDNATLAVLPEYRGGKSGLMVSSLLNRTFLTMGRQSGVRHVVTMLDHRAYRNMTLLGAPLVPIAGSKPFEYLGSPSTQALYVAFADIEPSIAEQARRLKRLGSSFGGEIRARGPRRLLIRRLAARVSGRVATGTGLDEHIVLPAAARAAAGGSGHPVASGT